MTESVYTVQGMTCSHCVASVTEEVGAIAGVQDLEVDLATGRVALTSEQPVSDAQIADAVREAGYELAG